MMGRNRLVLHLLHYIVKYIEGYIQSGTRGIYLVTREFSLYIPLPFSSSRDLYLNNQIVLFQVDHSNKGHKLIPEVNRKKTSPHSTIVRVTTYTNKSFIHTVFIIIL